MKNCFYTPIIILCALLCTLTACTASQPNHEPSAPPSTTQTSVVALTTTSRPTTTTPTTTATTPPPTEPTKPSLDITLPEGAVRLTAAELEWFNTQFFNRDPREHMQNQFLTSFYSTPSDIDLHSLFYNGMGGELSVEETDLLRSMNAAFLSMDIVKTTALQMDLVLQEYMGLSLEDTSQNGLDAFVYLPDQEAYYLAHGDTNWSTYTMADGCRLADGTILLLYSLDFPIDGSEHAVVTLNPAGDGTYWFVSHQLYTT